MSTASELIDLLQLTPHPEGGYFRETYRSEGTISEAALPPAYAGQRHFSTCIYFLLTSDKFSAFHRVRQDEIWHFYSGSPVRLHLLTPGSGYQEVVIGTDLRRGQTPQFVVPGGSWFAADVPNDDAFALVGCTVSPGFDFADFELAKGEELTTIFPEHAPLIKEFTRN